MGDATTVGMRHGAVLSRQISGAKPMATTERVWHDLHDRLLRFIRRRIRDEASAEDILQDVFLRIHARIATLEDEDRLESWVWQIVRHAITDHYRSRRPAASLSDELVAPDAADEDDAEDMARRLIPAVKAMVEALPEPYREALLLTQFDGLTQRELADLAGISLSGAKSRVQRGREKLKQLLLDCCHIELDRRGGIIACRPRRDYCAPRCDAARSGAGHGPA